MKRKLSTSKDQKRKIYDSPKLELIMLQMEEGIAAGSARVVLTDQTGDVIEEWETGTDRTNDINW